MQGRVLTARNLSTEIKPRVFFDALPGYVIFVDEILPGTQGLLERTILYQTSDSGGNPTEQLIVAKSATIAPATDRQGRLRLVFKDGVWHSFRSEEPGYYRSTQFDAFTRHQSFFPRGCSPPTSAPKRRFSDMTPRELWAEYQTAVASPEGPLRGFRLRSALAEGHRRLALPLARPVIRAPGTPPRRLARPQRQRGGVRAEPWHHSRLLDDPSPPAPSRRAEAESPWRSGSG
jgi:hypothetical protein